MDGTAHENFDLEIKSWVCYEVLTYSEVRYDSSQVPVQQCGLNTCTDGTKASGSHIIPFVIRFFRVIKSGNTLTDSVTDRADGQVSQHFRCKWV